MCGGVLLTFSAVFGDHHECLLADDWWKVDSSEREGAEPSCDLVVLKGEEDIPKLVDLVVGVGVWVLSAEAVDLLVGIVDDVCRRGEEGLRLAYLVGAAAHGRRWFGADVARAFGRDVGSPMGDDVDACSSSCEDDDENSDNHSAKVAEMNETINRERMTNTEGR